MATKMRGAKTGTDGEKASGRGSGGGPTAPVTFLVGSLITAYLFLTNPDPKSFEEYNFVNTALCLWVPLMTILFVLRQDPNQFGLARGDQRLGLKWALWAWIVMLLGLVIVSHRPEFQQQYLHGRLSQSLAGVGPVFADLHVNPRALLYYELGMGFYMFCWEFFFRGFLLFGLQKSRLGVWGAIIIQALLFTLLHWSLKASASKPSLEVLSALPGGLILGYFAYRTRSFIYGYLAHWAISMTLDLFQLAPFIMRHIG